MIKVWRKLLLQTKLLKEIIEEKNAGINTHTRAHAHTFSLFSSELFYVLLSRKFILDN